MIIDAEYEDIEDADGELDLSADDSLPWLEADDEDEGGTDNTQIIVLALILFGILLLAVGTVWIFGSKASSDEIVADGSVIEAPEGPFKERPEDPGGKEFAGTGTVAPVVGEGGTPEGVMDTDGAANNAAGSGTAGSATASNATASESTGQGDGSSSSSSSATTSRSGIGVQLAAYSSRARAEQGWNEISRRTSALSGLRYRIEEGEVDIGTVYRLQAVASDLASANSLCASLKSDGIDCQVKR